MKIVRIKTDSTVHIEDCGDSHFHELLGGWVEVVRSPLLPRHIVMLVDEEGLMKGLPMNMIGTILYGGKGFIVGEVLLVREFMTDDGPDIECLEDDDKYLLEVKKVLEAM